jgi:hypothetical protein
MSRHIDLCKNVLGMCYILCMCVCVGVSDMMTASDDTCASWQRPKYAQRSAPGVARGRGVRGNAPKFFFWAVFAIFSGFFYF